MKIVARRFGKSKLEISAPGLGCYATSGPIAAENDIPSGCGKVDETQDITREPAAFVLDLICRGLGQISKDHCETMDRGGLIYDVLYTQLKSEA